MSSQKAPRYQGRITSWKDEQGFGFITPNGGGPTVFVHISEFTDRGARPASNAVVTYYLGANEKGPRAQQVALVTRRASSRASSNGAKGTLVAAGGFLGFIGLCGLIGKIPLTLFWLYLIASAVAFLAYFADKSAARKQARRTPESTLHILGLAGGWPGALVAQQVLRHKSKKASFRSVFWATVAINCSVLVWILSPSGATVVRGVLGTP